MDSETSPSSGSAKRLRLPGVEVAAAQPRNVAIFKLVLPQRAGRVGRSGAASWLRKKEKRTVPVELRFQRMPSI